MRWLALLLFAVKSPAHDQPLNYEPPNAAHNFNCANHGLQRRKRIPRIIDGFLFNDEITLLRIRLAELYDVVDQFILVEAAQTHKGDPKPMLFERHKAQLERFLPKITHVPVLHFPFNCSQQAAGSVTKWGCENYQVRKKEPLVLNNVLLAFRAAQCNSLGDARCV
jgi:hypothetical protein